MKTVDKSIKHAPEGTFCSGCSACISVCPKKAISLQLNRAGFYEAVLDEALCINCGKCQKVCSRYQEMKGVSLHEAEHLAMQSQEREIVKTCSSGGLAYELALQAVENNEVVIGCIYNCENQKAEHICVENKEDLELLKGSKYVQSNAANAFRAAAEQAIKDKETRFTVFGTPCQIAGFARTAEQLGFRDRTLLVEIFCHGVPSYHVWDMQLEEIRKKLGGNPTDVQFRYKKDDWHSYCIKAERDGKVWYGTREKAEFWHVFFENVLLNDACMVCKERREESLADIRLGDYWGHRFEKHSDGVSAVFALNEKGEEAVQGLKNSHRLINLESGTSEEMLRAQNMSGYARDKKHKDAVNALESGSNVKDAIRIYRKQFTVKQKIKRFLLAMSSLLPADMRARLRKKNSSRYTKTK